MVKCKQVLPEDYYVIILIGKMLVIWPENCQLKSYMGNLFKMQIFSPYRSPIELECASRMWEFEFLLDLS